MSLKINQIGKDLLINLDQVCFVEKFDIKQLKFGLTSGTELTAIYMTVADRDAAFDNLQDTGPPGPPGQGPARGLGAP